MRPNDSNTEIPEQPAQNQVMSNSSMSRTIQPLSSEEEIKCEAFQAAPASHIPPTPITPETTGGYIDPYATSGLITEPLQHSVEPATLLPQSSPVVVDKPTKKKYSSTAIWAVVVLAGLAVGVYFFLPSRSISVSSLAEIEIQNTTYLHPNQWKAIDKLGTSAYGNSKSKSGKSTAIVAVVVSPAQYDEVTESQYPRLRAEIVSALSVENVAPAFQGDSLSCTTPIEMQKDEDASKSATDAGLYTVTASCQREDGHYTLKMRGIIGRDGYVRTITVMAERADWDKSAEAFTKMLNSLTQTRI